MTDKERIYQCNKILDILAMLKRCSEDPTDEMLIGSIADSVKHMREEYSKGIK
jgi:hypothetical protein